MMPLLLERVTLVMLVKKYFFSMTVISKSSESIHQNNMMVCASPWARRWHEVTISGNKARGLKTLSEWNQSRKIVKKYMWLTQRYVGIGKYDLRRVLLCPIKWRLPMPTYFYIVEG